MFETTARGLTHKPMVMLMVLTAGLAVGLVVAVQPLAGMLLIGLLGGALLLIFSRFVDHAALIACGALGLFGGIQASTFSAGAALTILVALGTWATWITLHQVGKATLPVCLVPFFLLIGWGTLVTAITYHFTVAGMQSMLVLLAFVGTIALSASLVARAPGDYMDALRRSMHIATALGVGSYVAGVLVPGLGISNATGARGFALFGLIVGAWYIAQWRHGSRVALLIYSIILAAIALSLSRLALGASIVLMAIALARPRGASGMARLAVMLGAVAVAGFMAIRRIEPLRQRFFEGDLAIEIYGVRINAMGRIDMWQVTLDSYREAPFLGKGVGAIHELIEARFPGLGHPHNDYLRILHDYGSVGFLLFTAGLLAMIFLSWSAWQRADRAADRDAAGVHLAAFLGLLAFSAAMLTDNVVVYVWVMVPLGVMVGASLGFPADGMHPRSADPPDDRST